MVTKSELTTVIDYYTNNGKIDANFKRIIIIFLSSRCCFSYDDFQNYLIFHPFHKSLYSAKSIIAWKSTGSSKVEIKPFDIDCELKKSNDGILFLKFANYILE